MSICANHGWKWARASVLVGRTQEALDVLLFSLTYSSEAQSLPELGAHCSLARLDALMCLPTLEEGTEVQGTSSLYGC